MVAATPHYDIILYLFAISEKLWGATATITKAIAASRNKMIRSHDGVGFYLASIARELKDESILNIVSIANSMHQNFYEDNLPPEVIRKASKTIKSVFKTEFNPFGERLKLFVSRMRRSRNQKTNYKKQITNKSQTSNPNYQTITNAWFIHWNFGN